MQWDEYKRLCDTPAVWSRWMLSQSIELLQHYAAADATLAAIAQQLQTVLLGPALAKPADHRGGAATDMYPLAISAREAAALVTVIRRAVADGVRSSGTMERGLGGFEAAWSEYASVARSEDAYGQDPFTPTVSTDNQEACAMNTASDRVMTMIDSWNRRDLDGIVECFAADAVYHNIPMEPVHGQAAIREAIAGFVAGASAIEWDTLHIAENAHGVVLTERVDKFKMGDKWIEVPVMGTFEVVDDRITAWRDYFDLAGFQSQIE